VRRYLGTLSAVLLLGLTLPTGVVAHTSVPPLATSAAAPVESAPTLRAAAPVTPSAAPLVVLLAGALLAAVRVRPRRALALALVALLAVLVAETAVHSVHHLADRGNARCATAATAGQLTVALDDGAPSVRVPAPLSVALTDAEWSRPLTPHAGPDPARAPPSPIA